MSVDVASANENELVSAISGVTDPAVVSGSATHLVASVPVSSQPKSQGKAARAAATAKPKKSKASTTKPTRKALTPKVQPAGAHPVYNQMVKEAIGALGEKKGSSKVAILKYILQHYNVGDSVIKVSAHVRQALKRGVDTGALEQTKGVGASGSFRLNKAAKIAKVAKKTLTPKKKPVAKKSVSSAKKSSAKKAAKSKSVKSAPVKKATKKTTTASLSATVKSASAASKSAKKKVVKKTAATSKKPTTVKKSPKKATAKKSPAAKSLKKLATASKQIKKTARK